MAHTCDMHTQVAYSRLRASTRALSALALDDALAHPLYGPIVRGFAARLRHRALRAPARPAALPLPALPAASDRKRAAAGDTD